MKSVNNIEKRNSIVSLVNSMIREAFGKGFKGNYTDRHSNGFSNVSESEKLGFIAKKGFLSYKVAGTFSRAVDGSLIAIFPDYESCAKKYARLYKEKTGKSVEVVILTY